MNLEQAVRESEAEKRQLLDRLHQAEVALSERTSELERMKGAFTELDHQLGVVKKERDFYAKWTGELKGQLKNIGALAERAAREVEQRMGITAPPIPPAPQLEPPEPPLPAAPPFLKHGNKGQVDSKLMLGQGGKAE
jgi:hypothetical protein